MNASVYLVGTSGTFGPMTEAQADFLRSCEYRRTGTGPNVCSAGLIQREIGPGLRQLKPLPTRDHPDAHMLAMRP